MSDDISGVDSSVLLGADQIEIADTVHHAPSGEDWVVARVTDKHVYPAGWPPCRAELTDCRLIEKATEQQRAEMLAELHRLPASDERHMLPNTELDDTLSSNPGVTTDE